MNSMSIVTGERITQLRKENKLTQAELAEKMHVKRETIFQWEAGTRQIKSEAIRALADEFGVTSDYLLGISDYRTLKTAGTTAENMGISEDAAAVLVKMNSAPVGSTEYNINRQTLNFINRALAASESVPFLPEAADAPPCIVSVFRDMEEYIHSSEYSAVFHGEKLKLITFQRKDDSNILDAESADSVFRDVLMSRIRRQLDELRATKRP